MYGRQISFGTKDKNDSVKESIWFEEAVNDKNAKVLVWMKICPVPIDLRIREIETRYWIKRKLQPNQETFPFLTASGKYIYKNEYKSSYGSTYGIVKKMERIHKGKS